MGDSGVVVRVSAGIQAVVFPAAAYAPHFGLLLLPGPAGMLCCCRLCVAYTGAFM